MDEASFDGCNFRFVMQLLGDVIYFVANKEDTGSDPLDIIVTKPDRERPKLLREQNVLKQVVKFVIH